MKYQLQSLTYKFRFVALLQAKHTINMNDIRSLFLWTSDDNSDSNIVYMVLIVGGRKLLSFRCIDVANAQVVATSTSLSIVDRLVDIRRDL